MEFKNKLLNFLQFSIGKIGSFLHVGWFELFFFVCCIIIYYGPTCYSLDGYYYFSQLISIFEDGDLDIYNNLANFPVENIEIRVNAWSIGPAIFWAPFYIIGHLAFLIATSIFPSLIGMFPEELLIFGLDVGLANLGTIFYAYLGFKILGKALNKYYNKKISPIFVLLFLFFCTPIIYYTFRLPLMAHTISFFLVSVLIYLWVKWHDLLTTKQIILIFITLGLASIVRWQNLLFVVIFLPQIKKTITHWRTERTFGKFLKPLFLHITIAFLSFLIAFSPQLIAWWLQFGIPIPQAHSISDFNFLNPNFYEVWFGRHGLFIWHPLFILCVVGLIFFFTQKDLDKFDGIVLILAFILQSYLWSIWVSPWAYCSFGMRGLIGCFPMLSFGLTNIILIGYRKNKKITKIILGIIFTIFSLMNLYLFAFLGAPYGDPTLRCESPLKIEWFFQIDWEMLKNTFIPTFPFEKIAILSGLGAFIILASSLINYFEIRKFQ